MGQLAPALFWPAVIGYGEAAVAYVGEAAFGARLARLAIWGVRLGWLAQTALLSAQVLSSDGFAWGSAASSLNLFVWMSVGGYLIWGCRRPYRSLGLAIMPLAVLLLCVTWASGGLAPTSGDDGATWFLAVHVGLVVAAFAGFTIGAAMAGAYLWLDRALRARKPGLSRLLLPDLATLDRLAAKTTAVSLIALTVGVALGLVRMQEQRGSLDAVVVTTLAAWVIYATYLVLRWEAGWVGRRAAYVALAGFALVIAVRVVLMPVGHFA